MKMKTVQPQAITPSGINDNDIANLFERVHQLEEVVSQMQNLELMKAGIKTTASPSLSKGPLPKA
jgi:hypothetical protein